MTTIRVASVADQDTIRCAVWLEQKQPGLGTDFLDALDRALVEIARQPLACPTLVLGSIDFKSPLRFLGLGRFPHIVVFEIHADEVMVLAVAHPHQDLETLLRRRVGAR